jgi:outer membrane protein OmpA-like peptidoglycan-associated protein
MKNRCCKLLALSSVAMMLAVAAQAQETAKLKMSVFPPQAYTFVDGQAIGPGNRTIKVSLGAHKVVVANYGYSFFQKEITVDNPKETVLKVSLDPAGAEVAPPRGRIQIELGHLSFHDSGEQAVLLNGHTANYFVGHVDEFNHDIIWHQELVVPPGTHHVTVTRFGHDVWSGDVAVAPNKRVIVDIHNGKEKIKDWSLGSQLGPLHRFKAGIASALVVVAPVSSEISATPAKIDCGQPSQLKWTSADTVDADISGMSPVPVTGEKTVSPKQATTYDFTATGPGGTTKSSATVDVNTVVQSSLNASPAEVHYRQIGDKTLVSDSTTLNWTSSNSDAASLTPYGTVETNGNKSVSIKPKQSNEGPVDETVQYTLTATNVCGGSETKTASVHITGSIEPIPNVPLQSVFFPTDYPTEKKPDVGLVRSQQDSLASLAAGLAKYLEYDQDAKLSLFAYTDKRGSNRHNQSLSERRAQRVKDYLVAQGVDPTRITTSAYGPTQQLDQNAVADLQAQNPNQPPEKRARNKRSTWLAYNRRVDIALLPPDRKSTQFYPNTAPDSDVLWQTPKPPEKKVEENQ